MKPITRAIILTRIVTVQSRVWASRMIVVEVVNVVVCVFVAVIVSVTVVFFYRFLKSYCISMCFCYGLTLRFCLS